MSDKDSLQKLQPLQDGTYRFNYDEKLLGLVYIEGNSVLFEGLGIKKGDERSPLEFSEGIFENPDKRGLKMAGEENYSLKIVMIGFQSWTHFAIVNKDRNGLFLSNGSTWDYLDEKALKKMEDELDPCDNYTHSYECKPGKDGKIIWITGGTGMGKTTTSDQLRKEHGFVYYEGDGFIFGANPYINNSPTGPSVCGTKMLKNMPQERIDAGNIFFASYAQEVRGETVAFSVYDNFYSRLCDDILKEKAKIGGDWVVAQAVYKRKARDLIREKLGNQCIFVFLSISKELQLIRLARRFLGPDGELTEEVKEATRKKFEESGATRGNEEMQSDEPNSFAIELTEDMDAEAVAQIILQKSKTI